MDFKQIEPLIESENFRHETLSVKFTCNETNVSQSTSVRVEQGMKKKIMATAGNAAKKELLRSAKRSLSRLIGSALGGGTAGRIGRNVTGSVVGGMADSASSASSSLNPEQREQAVLEAFDLVKSHFVFNENMGKWIGVQKDLIVPFFSVLEKNPVTERYDKITLAKMLTEITASDGSVGEDEKEFLNDFLPEEAGSLDDLLKKEALSKADLQETSKGRIRETMLLLCWGLAFCDDELSTEEKERIGEFAEWLDISGEKLESLKEMAAQYVMDQMLTSMIAEGNFEANKNEIYDLASKLDVSEEIAKRTEINFKKRNLLF